MEHQAFVDAVCSDPHDDGVRLIYADWLEEHGDSARAEFIRVQVQLAYLPPARKRYEAVDSFSIFRGEGRCFVEGEEVQVGDRVDLLLSKEEVRRALGKRGKQEWFGVEVVSVSPGSTVDELGGAVRRNIEFRVDEGSVPCPGTELRKREEELLNKYRDNWSNLTPPVERTVAPIGQIGATFRRGFIAVITCILDCWMQYGPIMISRCPVEEVHLTDRHSHRLLGDGPDHRWCWVEWTSPAPDDEDLPLELFDKLPPGDGDRQGDGTWWGWWYSSKEVAAAALSTACIALAREKTGLPPLPSPKKEAVTCSAT